MAAPSVPRQPEKPAGHGFKTLVICLVVVMLAFFHSSFNSSQALFSNDSPLGLIAAHADFALSSLAGWWEDLFWLGGQQPGGLPTLGSFWYLLVGPVAHAKTMVPFSLIVLAFSAWLFFRELRFGPTACVLGSLAACLNMNAFSNACWGLPAWVLARAMVFLALTAIVSAQRQRTAIKLILAGLAVGMCCRHPARRTNQGGTMGFCHSVEPTQDRNLADHHPRSLRLPDGYPGRRTVLGCYWAATGMGKNSPRLPATYW